MAIRISMAFEHPFSMDLLVRTPQQIERGLKYDDWFLREIMEKGMILYETNDRDRGMQEAGERATASSRRG